MKRYISIDHIYIEKLAELCGENFYSDNSYNLRKCEQLHDAGYSWKTIYFALLEYRSWYEKWNDEHLTSCGSWDFEKSMRFGKNSFDPYGHTLNFFLNDLEKEIDEHVVAEEFFFRNMQM